MIAARGRRSSLTLLALALVLATPGCYALHAANGQIGIWWNQIPIDEALADPDLPEAQREKLALVVDVRRYAIEELGLSETGSYKSYYETPGDFVAWNVSASAPLAFQPYTWDFPFVGSLPYIGYFREPLAVEEAADLAGRGYDALMLPVPAYSTLGWFEDPFLSSMLRYHHETIADILIHEMTHATVFVADVEFNETLATFVGREGARRYFLERDGPASVHLRRMELEGHDEELFDGALRELKQALWRVYEAAAPEEAKRAGKAARIAAFRARMRDEVLPAMHDPRGYAYVLDPDYEINNAWLLARLRYHGDLPAFTALHEHLGSDLRQTIVALGEVAQAADPRAELRLRAR
ncbi:MAG: aminopeptidase [Planctomycetes bacterium]|nr:aminopeptidase [Planctomycetota bacterium]